MKKHLKRIVNCFIAVTVAQTPLLFPEDGIMLMVFILGLVSIFIVVYSLLECITNLGRNNK